MRAVIGCVAAATLAVIVGTSAGTASSRAASRVCAPVSTTTTEGRYSYEVRVDRGTVSCAVARRIIKAANDVFPPGRGWLCAIGSPGDAWALSCTEGPNVIRALGPTLIRAIALPQYAYDPWQHEAETLGAFLYKPSFTAGLPLTLMTEDGCRGSQFSLIADYGAGSGRTLSVAEGKPHACGNLGIPARLATWWIHGQPATLAEDCGPIGCSRLTGEYSLIWREGGREITLFTHDFGQHDLLAVARSFTRIP